MDEAGWYFFCAANLTFLYENHVNFCYHLQNVADLSDLVTSGRDSKHEEVKFAEECALKSLAFRAERYSSHILFILYCELIFVGFIVVDMHVPSQEPILCILLTS